MSNNAGKAVGGGCIGCILGGIVGALLGGGVGAYLDAQDAQAAARPQQGACSNSDSICESLPPFLQAAALLSGR
jgi:hypothetical protein